VAGNRRHKQQTASPALLDHLPGSRWARKKVPPKLPHYVEKSFLGVGQKVAKQCDTCIGDSQVQASKFCCCHLHQLLNNKEVAGITATEDKHLPPLLFLLLLFLPAGINIV
jgi:hypothetical protein